jgi:hypothetical protein
MINIKVYTLLLPVEWEKLEDELRDFFESKGCDAVIDNEITGNTTKTRKRGYKDDLQQ